MSTQHTIFYRFGSFAISTFVYSNVTYSENVTRIFDKIYDGSWIKSGGRTH